MYQKKRIPSLPILPWCARKALHLVNMELKVFLANVLLMLKKNMISPRAQKDLAKKERRVLMTRKQARKIPIQTQEMNFNAHNKKCISNNNSVSGRVILLKAMATKKKKLIVIAG